MNDIINDIDDVNRDTYRVDIANLTVIRLDRNGEAFDLNGGEGCLTVDELRSFVAELAEFGAFGAEQRDELLAAIDDE